MAILELRGARGWSRAETARRFQVEPETIAEWMRRVDDGDESALLKTPEPVNRFPEFVRHVVRRLKTLCPTLGKKRIAQTLARAGLHLGATTVGRMLKEKGTLPPAESGARAEAAEKKAQGPVRSKHPNHVWLVDLTVVPTSAGFWTAWVPFSVPQLWPFCWWGACVVDHFSRRVMGFAVFRKEPRSREVCAFLGRVVAEARAVPRYLLSDQGRQFWCGGYRAWCRRRGIRPRYASVEGHVRATAIIERFFRSLKGEWLRRKAVPLRRGAMRRRIAAYVAWFHEHRPHQGLGGRTPEEVFLRKRPRNERARLEPRARWPARSGCAGPLARRRVKNFSRLALVVRFHRGHRQLPVVELKRVA